MSGIATKSTVVHPFAPVKSINSQLPLPFPDSVNTHSKPRNLVIRGNRDKVWRDTSYYGCSKVGRYLSPQFLLKHFDNLRDLFANNLGCTAGERECLFNIIRLWAYYGKVYPKAAQFSEYPGCSKMTFRRTIRKLVTLNVIVVIKRYLEPYRRQISNLLQLDKLLILIARYLAEHGVGFLEKWLKPALTMPGQQFWSQIFLTPGDRAGPGVVEFSSS